MGKGRSKGHLTGRMVDVGAQIGKRRGRSRRLEDGGQWGKYMEEGDRGAR